MPSALQPSITAQTWTLSLSCKFKICLHSEQTKSQKVSVLHFNQAINEKLSSADDSVCCAAHYACKVYITHSQTSSTVTFTLFSLSFLNNEINQTKSTLITEIFISSIMTLLLSKSKKSLNWPDKQTVTSGSFLLWRFIFSYSVAWL